MTTTQTPARPAPIDAPELNPYFRGYLLIPLSEFGQSLDNPDLDTWFESFAERNKDELGDFEITAPRRTQDHAPYGIPWRMARG